MNDVALEMRVYEELTDVDPKVLVGLTLRQLAGVSVWVLLLAIVAPVFWLMDLISWISWVMIVPAVPIVLWAWVKPAGLRFEVYLRLVWTYLSRPKRRLYRNWAAWSALQRTTYEGKKAHVVGKQRQKHSRQEAGR